MALPFTKPTEVKLFLQHKNTKMERKSYASKEEIKDGKIYFQQHTNCSKKLIT